MKSKYMFNAAGVIGGLPYTRYDFEHLTELKKEDQEMVRRWIITNLKPAIMFGRRTSSEELRKALYKSTGVQLTNNQMKHAMMICGYEPKCVTDFIWEYRLSYNSPYIQEEMKHGRI